MTMVYYHLIVSQARKLITVFFFSGFLVLFISQ